MTGSNFNSNNIADQGRWSASSGKKSSLQMLFQETDECYQSCSPCTPHNLFCQFYKEKYIESIRIKLDITDDTYYPDRIKIKCGSRMVLVTVCEWTMKSTLDTWIVIPVNHNTFTLCISVTGVKNGGQDTRISEIQIIGK